MQDYNEFRKAIQFTLDWETSKGTRVYSNDPDDPGGETKWGVTKRSYPNLDIKNLAREEAISIYAKDYWDACGCDDIPFPLNVAVFDVAVMSGSGVAKQLVKNAISLQNFFEKRREFLLSIVQRNPKMKKYINGWLNRTNDLKKFIETNTPQEEPIKKGETPWDVFKRTLLKGLEEINRKATTR